MNDYPGPVPIFLILFFILEHLFPLRRSTRSLLQRLTVNIFFSLITLALAGVWLRSWNLSALSWSISHSIGLGHWLPTTGTNLVSFLLLDLTFYYWHFANHQIPFLWRFHNVHHLDPDMDVTTAFRFHFAEVLFSTVFRTVQIVVIGPSLQTFLVYEVWFQIAVFFHHSNLRLPLSLERILSFVFVTPRLHEVHHSQTKADAQSNFGVLFSVWDRIHRTLIDFTRQRATTIGVPAYRSKHDNTVAALILAPFKKQKDYWNSN